jgi:hypothetical protein
MRQDEYLATGGRKRSGGRKRNLRSASTPAEALLLQGRAHIVKGATGLPMGRPRRGLEAKALASALERYCPVDELRAALGEGRHRTAEQRKQLESLAVFTVLEKPNVQALADLLGCKPKTIYSYRKEGVVLLEQLLPAEWNEKLDSIDGKLDEIRTMLGLDLASTAERILSDEDSAVTKVSR